MVDKEAVTLDVLEQAIAVAIGDGDGQQLVDVLAVAEVLAADAMAIRELEETVARLESRSHRANERLDKLEGNDGEGF